MVCISNIDGGIEENYLSFATAICEQSVSDSFTEIKKLNSRLVDGKKRMLNVEKTKCEYDELVLNHPEKVADIRKRAKQLFEYKERGLQLSPKGKSNTDSSTVISHIKGDILSLEKFFKSEWFYILHGGELDYKTVMRTIIERVCGKRNIDTFSEYIEYFDNEIKVIEKYITEQSVVGISIEYVI